MSSIAHYQTDCQDPPQADVTEYYVDGEGIVRQPSASQPIATPISDLLAASFAAGLTDAAGADAEIMTLAEWQEAHGNNGLNRWEYRPIHIEEVGS